MTDAKLTTDALLDAIFEAFRMHSSPTVDHGDSHGERGQGGMLIWKSSHPFIRAAVTAALVEFGLRVLADELIEESVRDGKNISAVD